VKILLRSPPQKLRWEDVDQSKSDYKCAEESTVRDELAFRNGLNFRKNARQLQTEKQKDQAIHRWGF